MMDLDRVNNYLARVEESEKTTFKPVGSRLKVGVDLGTAYIVLVVLDEENNPVACEKQAAQVLRDGVVVDYINVLFMHFAIFNFADICVCVGVGLLMLVVLLDSFKKEETAKQKADDDGAA